MPDRVGITGFGDLVCSFPGGRPRPGRTPLLRSLIARLTLLSFPRLRKVQQQDPFDLLDRLGRPLHVVA